MMATFTRSKSVHDRMYPVAAEPAPASILERLNRVAAVAGRFHGDEAGWFRADLIVAESEAQAASWLPTHAAPPVITANPAWASAVS